MQNRNKNKTSSVVTFSPIQDSILSAVTFQLKFCWPALHRQAGAVDKHRAPIGRLVQCKPIRTEPREHNNR